MQKYHIIMTKADVFKTMWISGDCPLECVVVLQLMCAASSLVTMALVIACLNSTKSSNSCLPMATIFLKSKSKLSQFWLNYFILSLFLVFPEYWAMYFFIKSYRKDWFFFFKYRHQPSTQSSKMCFFYITVFIHFTHELYVFLNLCIPFRFYILIFISCSSLQSLPFLTLTFFVFVIPLFCFLLFIFVSFFRYLYTILSPSLLRMPCVYYSVFPHRLGKSWWCGWQPSFLLSSTRICALVWILLVLNCCWFNSIHYSKCWDSATFLHMLSAIRWCIFWHHWTDYTINHIFMMELPVSSSVHTRPRARTHARRERERERESVYVRLLTFPYIRLIIFRIYFLFLNETSVVMI